MKKKIFICLIIFIVIALCSLFIINYIKINSEYPQTKIEKYNSDETIAYNDLEIKVIDKQWLNKSQLLKDYKNEVEMFSKYDYKYVVLTVQYKNISDKKIEIEAYSSELQTREWSNGVNGVMSYEMSNSKEGLFFSLEAGEVKEVKLPYFLLDKYFKQSTWENIEDNDFYFVITRYPIKRMILI